MSPGSGHATGAVAPRRTYRSLLLSVVALALVAIPRPAPAADALEPGLWEITSKAERNGVVTERPTRRKCMTAEDARAVAARTKLSGEVSRLGESCKVVESHKTDRGMAWRMQCTGAFPAEQTGSYVFDSPRHYTTVLETTTTVGRRTLTSTRTTEGRRVGECPK